MRKKSERPIRHVALFGMFTALAFILSYIESLIPFSFGIPGIKLGLANLVVLTFLYGKGAKEAYILSVVRIILTGFTFGNMYSMFYSLIGGLLSLSVMVLLKKTGKFTVMGVSAAGGVFHNVGQILVASMVLGRNIAYYFPFLMVSGIITGLLIGLLGGYVVKRLRLMPV